MTLILLGGALCLVGFVCALFILTHAFRLSTGTGMMALFIPGYVLFYGFSQFEHRFKGPLVAGFLGLSILGALLIGIGVGGASGVIAERFQLPR